MHDKRDMGIDRRIDELMKKVSTGGLHSIHMPPADLTSIGTVVFHFEWKENLV